MSLEHTAMPTLLKAQVAQQPPQDLQTAQQQLQAASQAIEQARRTVRNLDAAVKQAGQQAGLGKQRGLRFLNRPAIQQRTDLTKSARKKRTLVLIACFNRLRTARTEATFSMARMDRAVLTAHDEVMRAYETAYDSQEESDEVL